MFSELHNLGGLDNFSSGGSGGSHHLPQMNHGFGSHNDFSNGYRHHQQHQFGGPLTSPTENHLGHQLRGGGHHHQQQQHHQQHSHPLLEKTSKDWQEGFRALLPNVNVSFGALPNQSEGGSGGLHTPPMNGRLFSSPTSAMNDHHHHHHHNHHDRVQQQRQQQHTGERMIKILLRLQKVSTDSELGSICYFVTI